MFFYALLLIFALSTPTVSLSNASVSIVAVDYNGNTVLVSGYQVGNVRVTNVGNFTIEETESGYSISYSSNSTGVRYLKISAEYKAYEARSMGRDRDVVYDIGDVVLYVHSHIPLETNGSYIRFEASSFTIDVGIYHKGSINYYLLVLSIALLIIGIASKLFPRNDR